MNENIIGQGREYWPTTNGRVNIIQPDINKQFSLSFEIEFKKTFYDFLDNTSGANNSNINNVIYKPNTSVVKNYQYGSGNDNDFYYFTGISISYIFYKIPCPKDSAPYNSIY